ncbi:MAG: glycosyltransferase [Pseudomonadota bacterium]
MSEKSSAANVTAPEPNPASNGREIGADRVSLLERENALLRMEIDRLHGSLRMRAANVIAEARATPAGLLTAAAGLWRLVWEAHNGRRWRRLLVGLECGLPNDPLRTATPPGRQAARQITALAAAARKNAAPPISIAEGDDAAVKMAFDRFCELRRLADEGPAPIEKRPPPASPKRSINGFRVLNVLHAGEPDLVNGYTRRSHELLKALRQEGVDASAVLRTVSDDDGAVIHDGVAYRRAPAFMGDGLGPSAYVEAYAASIAHAIKEYDPEIIHAASNHITGLAAARAARRAGKAFIYEVRGLWEVTRASIEPGFADSVGFAMQRRMELETAKAADRVVVNGAGLAGFFAEHGVAVSKIVVVDNGCDTAAFDAAAARVSALRDDWSLDDRPVIGFVGSITPYEGLEDVVAACAKRVQRDFQLLIVGDGPSRPAIADAVARAGLSDLARLPGRVDPEAALAAYGLIDIAPLVRRDSAVARLIPPLKPLEALAGRCAVIVSDLPALAPFVANGAGLTTPPGDPAKLADLLGALLDDDARRAGLMATGHARAETEYSWRGSAKKLIDAYQAALTENLSNT